jgi:hypothetical protein
VTVAAAAADDDRPKHEPVGPWQILVAATALGASLSVVVFLYTRLGRLFGSYLESLRLFAVVQRAEETD